MFSMIQTNEERNAENVYSSLASMHIESTSCTTSNFKLTRLY